MSKSSFFLFLLFISGLIFRLSIVKFFPQPFIYDQLVYDQIAKKILKIPFYVDAYRYYGYPLIVAISYKLTVLCTYFNLFNFQILMDSFTGLFIYFIGKKLFKLKIIAFISSTIYFLNPYTAAYVGVELSEISATFCVILIVFLLVNLLKYKHNFINSILFFIILGILPQIKPSFFYFSFIVFIASIIYIFRNYKNKFSILFPILYSALYFSTFLYTVIGNFMYFKELTPFSLVNGYIKEMYLSLYIDRPSSYISLSQPLQFQITHDDYARLIDDQGAKNLNAKYKVLILQQIKKDPIRFISWRFNKMWYIWQKQYLFLYSINWNDKIINLSVYFGNQLIILLGILGFYMWNKSNKVMQTKLNKLSLFIIFIFVYASVVHAFTIADERYTIPLYPIIILFSGMGIWVIINYFKKHKIIDNREVIKSFHFTH